jgi:hypothetical protein
MITTLKKHFEEQWHKNRFQFLYMEENKEIKRDYENLKTLCDRLKEKQVGEIIQFKESRTENFEILIKNERFIIAAPKSRNHYTIIDTEYGVCGPSNRTFGISVKSEDSLKEAMEGLTKGDIYLSYRYSAPIDVVLIEDMNENVSRENMLTYLNAFGKCAYEYYVKLDDEKLKQEYEDATNA